MVDVNSVVLNTPAPTGADTSGTSGTSGTPCYFNELNQIHQHLKTQVSYDSAKSMIDSVGCEVDSNVYVDEFKEIFRIHCNGNIEQSAVKALYNFYTKKWNITINNEANQNITFQFTTNPLSIKNVNVITVNTFRKLDFGCAIRLLLHSDASVRTISYCPGNNLVPQVFNWVLTCEAARSWSESAH
jgi:hypothetical protein